jgi:hypothetical protein
LFILKQNEIKDADAEAWIISSTTKLCNDYFSRQKKDAKLKEEYTRNHKEDLYNFAKTEPNITLREAYNKALDTLTEPQMLSLNLYYHCEQNYKLMSLITEASEPALRKRISRIRKKLRAKTFLNLGVIASKKIITPDLHEVLYKFLMRFKKNLENGTLSKMYYYFSETDLKNYQENIHIKSITEYEVELEYDIYKIYVFYVNTKDETEAFTFSFKIVNNQLKIVSPPQIKEKATFVPADSELAKQIKALFEKYPNDEFGVSTVPDELFQEVIRKYGVKNS